MKYGALIGLVLVVVDYIVDKAEKRTLTKEIEKTQNELNAVKAQLFDKQQSPATAPSISEDSKPTDEATSGDSPS